MAMVNDLETMKRFQQQLEEIQDQINNSLKKTDEAIEEASKTWKDSLFTQFQEKFVTDKQGIENVKKQITDTIENEIHPRINILDKYLTII